MYLLDHKQTQTISGSASVYSQQCYESYKAIYEQNRPGLGALMAGLFTGGLAFIPVAAYQMGLRDAAKTICGDAFNATEAYYCSTHSSCMKPEEKTKK